MYQEKINMIELLQVDCAFYHVPIIGLCSVFQQQSRLPKSCLVVPEQTWTLIIWITVQYFVCNYDTLSL